ncbi:transposase-like protein [Methylobacterium goesingense]|uniref:Transposase-like protein n=1 Tax=Methylobacterium goesingense TaxID=243690 RepID=A0ABV2LAG9_9HYPH
MPLDHHEMMALRGLMDETQPDVLACMGFPAAHRIELHGTNSLEHLNHEIERRTEVDGIFPDAAVITRLVGAILPERNDERAVQRSRSIALVGIAPSAMIPGSACAP